jgi:hypothetical protein
MRLRRRRFHTCQPGLIRARAVLFFKETVMAKLAISGGELRQDIEPQDLERSFIEADRGGGFRVPQGKSQWTVVFPSRNQ